jgi:carboxylate-amine ligase
MLIRENRWRAMRYSFDEGLIDLARGRVVPFEDLMDELCSLVSEDAKALGCEEELKGIHNILSRGTSAHRQLKDYELERASGTSVEKSLESVVDTLIADTAEGL